MKKTDITAEFKESAEKLLQCHKLQKIAERLVTKYSEKFSQIAADHEFTGEYKSESGSGDIRVTRQAQLVRDIDDLDAEKRDALIEKQFLQRHYRLGNSKKLEELLGEIAIKMLINGGALKEQFRTIGSGKWNAILLNKVNLKRDSNLENNIDYFVSEKLMEWATPSLNCKLSKEEVNSDPKNDGKQFCDECGDFEGPFHKMPNIHGPGLHLCEDCWANQMSQILIEDIEDGDIHPDSL